ncbi:MBL fold metallo-hydrolase [Gloeobacter kilaueensis]|uniref:L-ascorbate 6-phosphate lactonase n=1 Tax=Gloeobacter kilaueensis (strain ATCC BAA-2537 / CCAP 1431/1 / ULC 316 / JS1) TaxID=1183438 RepID=U5QG17_GLOK1|nr:MBL fold metallo-hydrolase [Gloeobacter kilaueensis]AGY57861.1 L-ascorbate 6-phosphate lactonase [Gloeobacter kilaueensis JS1]
MGAMTSDDRQAIVVRPLGQAGFKLTFEHTVVYIDPYLSDYVAKVEGPDMRRQISIPVLPETIDDADWVFISHIHIDHCDPETLLPISRASQTCRFLCPNTVKICLSDLGIAPERLVLAPEKEWLPLGPHLRVRAVPAVHPCIERDESGCLLCVGYVLDYRGRLLYHAGDTSPADELVEALKQLGTIDTALLPVNERNFYRERRGILGNMSVREAFQLADEIGTRTVVPMHWDMFAPNAVFREEIELLYQLLQPSFQLRLQPTSL